MKNIFFAVWVLLLCSCNYSNLSSNLLATTQISLSACQCKVFEGALPSICSGCWTSQPSAMPLEKTETTTVSEPEPTAKIEPEQSPEADFIQEPEPNMESA